MQNELFERDECAALADDVDAIGRKEVATMFKGQDSDFDPEDGAKWVSNCLDPKRNHKFSLEQVTVIVNEARKRGSCSYITYLLAKTYFEPTRPKSYEAEVKKAGDQLSGLLGQAKGVVEYLSQLEQQVKK